MDPNAVALRLGSNYFFVKRSSLYMVLFDSALYAISFQSVILPNWLVVYNTVN